MPNQCSKKFAQGTVPCSFQDHPTRLSCRVGWSWNWQFVILTIMYPKMFWQNNVERVGFQNYMGACFQAPHAAPRQRLMEMHHVH